MNSTNLYVALLCNIYLLVSVGFTTIATGEDQKTERVAGELV